MSAAANIVIADSTPTNRTFAPVRKNGDVVEYEDRSTNQTPQGFGSISISQTPLKSGTSPVVRQKINFAWPHEVTDSGTGLISVDSVARFTIEVILPKTTSSVTRAHMAAFLKNLAAHATITSLISSLDAPY